MADMFGIWGSVQAVRSPRRWSTLPVSIGVHGAVLAAIVIVPLAATGALPTPASVVAFSLVAPPPPPELPPPPAVSAPSPAAAPATVPVEAPDTIVADPDPPRVASPELTLGDLVVPGSVALPVDARPVLLPVPPPAPVRVGPGVQTPVKLVDLPPVYPQIARQAHVSGLVVIEAVIGSDGRVTDARVLKSVPLLDAAALAAVRQWRYRPTLLGGVPVPIVLTVTVNFTLR